MPDQFEWSVDYDTGTASVFLRISSPDQGALSLRFTLAGVGKLIYALLEASKGAAKVGVTPDN